MPDELSHPFVKRVKVDLICEWSAGCDKQFPKGFVRTVTFPRRGSHAAVRSVGVARVAARYSILIVLRAAV